MPTAQKYSEPQFVWYTQSGQADALAEIENTINAISIDKLTARIQLLL